MATRMITGQEQKLRIERKVLRYQLSELRALVREAYWTAKNPHVWRDWDARAKKALKGRVNGKFNK